MENTKNISWKLSQSEFSEFKMKVEEENQVRKTINCPKCRQVMAEVGDDGEFLQIANTMLFNIAYLMCADCGKTHRWTETDLKNFDFKSER